MPTLRRLGWDPALVPLAPLVVGDWYRVRTRAVPPLGLSPPPAPLALSMTPWTGAQPLKTEACRGGNHVSGLWHSPRLDDGPYAIRRSSPLL